MHRWSVFVLLAILAHRASADDGAHPPAPPSDAAKAQAKAHADEGTKQFNIQQYAKAAGEYQQAYLLDPQPTYLYARAQAQRLGGDCENALLSYRAYLRERPGDDKATKNIERCEQELKDHAPGGIGNESFGIPAPIAPIGAPPVAPAPPEQLVSRPWSGDWLGHVLVGGGLLAAAGGTVVFLSGRSAVRDLNNATSYDQYAALSAAADGGKTKETIGVFAMAAGAALVVGGVIHYVFHVQPVPESSVTAVVTPMGATVGLAGAF